MQQWKMKHVWSQAVLILASSLILTPSSLATSAAVFQNTAASIVANIAQYSKLYVSYQNCAWSPYYNEEDDSCGEESDDQYWYMGSTECFRANIAYSLYGIIDGQEDTGCDKTSFITSLFTTTGIQAFSEALASLGVSFTADQSGYGNDKYPSGVTSECTLEDNKDNNINNDDDGMHHNQKKNLGAISYGVSCNGKAFAFTKFNSSYCDTNGKNAYIDQLSTFNQEIAQANCLMIYQASSSNEIAVGLLEYSKECNVRDFPSECPDPYSILAANARLEAKVEAMSRSPRAEKLKQIFTWILFGLGIFFILMAVLVRRKRLRQARLRAEKYARYQKKRWGLFSKKRKSLKHNAVDSDGEKLPHVESESEKTIETAAKSLRRESSGKSRSSKTRTNDSNKSKHMFSISMKKSRSGKGETS